MGSAAPARALVTGVRGQDGSYLAERLVALGAEVHGLTHRADGASSPAADGVRMHEGDLRDPGLFGRLLTEVRPTEVYHLAGLSSVAQSWRDPVLAGEVSGLAVARLLDAVVRHVDGGGEPVRVLQASSAEVFGAAATSPQSERTPLRPVSPYGAAKAYAQHLVQVYRGRGLHASCAILYNHESPRRPPTFVTRKITQAVAAIATGSEDDLVLGDLQARRDWGWAPDYVDAMLRMVRHHTADDYVVATGHSHSVAEFVAAAFARAGVSDWQHRVRTDPSFVRPVETAEQVGDPRKATEVLDWHPTVGFEEIVGRMVDADLALRRESAA